LIVARPMNTLITLILVVFSGIAFSQERQQLSVAKVKTKTEFLYQFKKNGRMEEKGRFLSKITYNKKGEAVEDSIVWTEGMWQKGKTTYNEQGEYLTNLNIVKKEDGRIDTSFTTYYYQGDSVKKTFDRYGMLKSHEVKVNDTLKKFYDGFGNLIYMATEKETLVNQDDIYKRRTSITSSPEGLAYNYTIYYLDKEGKVVKKEIDNNRIEKYIYDAKVRRIEAAEFTMQNEVAGKTTYNYNDKDIPTEIISYDEKGKPIDKIKCFYEYFE